MHRVIDPADAFGGDDEEPVADPRREGPTSRPRTVRARQRGREKAEARGAAVREALGGRRGGAVELPDVLPAPPADPVEPASQELIALGNPPPDPLEAQAWLHRAMVVAAREAIQDPALTAADRRKELRNFAKVAAVLLPDARRWQAEKAIAAAQRGDEERAVRGPDLEAVPAELEYDDGDAAQPG